MSRPRPRSLPEAERVSTRRSAIIDVIATAQGPLTPRDIFQRMAERDYPVSLPTIYRTLGVLVASGQVLQSWASPNTGAVYSSRPRNDGLVALCCRRCARSWRVDDPLLADALGRFGGAGVSASEQPIVSVICDRCGAAGTATPPDAPAAGGAARR